VSPGAERLLVFTVILPELLDLDEHLQAEVLLAGCLYCVLRFRHVAHSILEVELDKRSLAIALPAAVGARGVGLVGRTVAVLAGAVGCRPVDGGAAAGGATAGLTGFQGGGAAAARDFRALVVQVDVVERPGPARIGHFGAGKDAGGRGRHIIKGGGVTYLWGVQSIFVCVSLEARDVVEPGGHGATRDFADIEQRRLDGSLLNVVRYCRNAMCVS